MNYQELKKEIKAIADVAAGVPEAFQVRCFEILLQSLLATANAGGGDAGSKKADALTDAGVKKPDAGACGGAGAGGGAADGGIKPMAYPSQIRVFMSRTGVTEEELQKLLLMDGSEIHFIKEPTGVKIAQGQIAWSLLLALKNGLAQNNLVVDPEDVRSICQEKGFYDQSNFASNFKKGAANLFTGPMEKQGQPQKLSNEGHAALGVLVKKLVGGGL